MRAGNDEGTKDVTQQHAKIFDLAPATFTGPFQRSRCRVIWREGKLMVFTGEEEFRVFDAPEPPVKRRDGRTWTTATTDGGQATWARTGCSCGFKLAKMPRRKLLAQVDATLAEVAG